MHAHIAGLEQHWGNYVQTIDGARVYWLACCGVVNIIRNVDVYGQVKAIDAKNKCFQ